MTKRARNSTAVRGSPRQTLPAEPGQLERQDYEYTRNGSASLLLWYEPLAGPCSVSVRDQHTGVDIANVLRRLSEEVYPNAKKIVLVCDNLSTHKVHFLYDKFTPEEARRLSERFEWHYTPEHGSWLNIAECALSVLSRQCLNRRIADLAALRSEVAAWEQERNQQPHTVKWQFRAEDARIKLKRLYPIQSYKTSRN